MNQHRFHNVHDKVDDWNTQCHVVRPLMRELHSSVTDQLGNEVSVIGSDEEEGTSVIVAQLRSCHGDSQTFSEGGSELFARHGYEYYNQGTTRNHRTSDPRRGEDREKIASPRAQPTVLAPSDVNIDTTSTSTSKAFIKKINNSNNRTEHQPPGERNNHDKNATEAVQNVVVENNSEGHDKTAAVAPDDCDEQVVDESPTSPSSPFSETDDYSPAVPTSTHQHPDEAVIIPMTVPGAQDSKRSAAADEGVRRSNPDMVNTPRCDSLPVAVSGDSTRANNRQESERSRTPRFNKVGRPPQGYRKMNNSDSFIETGETTFGGVNRSLSNSLGKTQIANDNKNNLSLVRFRPDVRRRSSPNPYSLSGRRSPVIADTDKNGKDPNPSNLVFAPVPSDLGPLILVQRPYAAFDRKKNDDKDERMNFENFIDMSAIEEEAYENQVKHLQGELLLAKQSIEGIRQYHEEQLHTLVEEKLQQYQQDERQRRAQFQDALQKLKEENAALLEQLEQQQKTTHTSEGLEAEWQRRLGEVEGYWQERLQRAELRYTEQAREQTGQRQTLLAQVRDLTRAATFLEEQQRQLQEEKDQLLIEVHHAQQRLRPQAREGSTNAEAVQGSLPEVIAQYQQREEALLLQLESYGEEMARKEAVHQEELAKLRSELAKERSRGAELVDLYGSQIQSLHQQLRAASSQKYLDI